MKNHAVCTIVCARIERIVKKLKLFDQNIETLKLSKSFTAPEFIGDNKTDLKVSIDVYRGQEVCIHERL